MIRSALLLAALAAATPAAIVGCEPDDDRKVNDRTGSATSWINRCQQIGVGLFVQVAARNTDPEPRYHQYAVVVGVFDAGTRIATLTGRSSNVPQGEYGAIDISNSGPYPKATHLTCVVDSIEKIN